MTAADSLEMQKQDSLAVVEKNRQDSIAAAEEREITRQDSLATVEKGLENIRYNIGMDAADFLNNQIAALKNDTTGTLMRKDIFNAVAKKFSDTEYKVTAIIDAQTQDKIITVTDVNSGKKTVLRNGKLAQ